MSLTSIRSRRLAWHYWVSALRLTAGVTALSIIFTSLDGLAAQIGTATLAPWLFAIVTDVFLLTVDLWRTSVYCASLFSQLIFPTIPTLTLVISSIMLVKSQEDRLTWAILLVVLLQLFAALCSIGLCVSLVLAFRDARARDPEVSWVVNGKDLIAGTIDISSRTTFKDTTWFGRKRAVDLKPYIFPTRHTFVNFGGAARAYDAKAF
ncbi:hypothetical protein BDV93DRAFT_604462 [Ceratobasidium sp. AG-I]|nr:hypothetical protein BDV93DRAFT_604462 [Ceratobasidium sp. AG-I]